MNNVVEFPTKSVRDWAIIERSMKEGFAKNNVSLAVERRLVEKMKAFYELINFQFGFSIDIEFPNVLSKEQIASICSALGDKLSASTHEQLHVFTNKLFVDRLDREFEICRELGL